MQRIRVYGAAYICTVGVVRCLVAESTSASASRSRTDLGRSMPLSMITAQERGSYGPALAAAGGAQATTIHESNHERGRPSTTIKRRAPARGASIALWAPASAPDRARTKRGESRRGLARAGREPLESCARADGIHFANAKHDRRRFASTYGRGPWASPASNSACTAHARAWISQAGGTVIYIRIYKYLVCT
ncbi:hypothetical protein C8Q79DRAFT_530298 [Trametes meyenii]|nr:hypothetical protein C8Q79DRAFT_530298 [Trametes meyenii]